MPQCPCSLPCKCEEVGIYDIPYLTILTVTGALSLDRGDCVQEGEPRGSWYAVVRLDDATVNCWNHTSANGVADVTSDFVDALRVSMRCSSGSSKTPTYPISHRASSIVASKQFRAFPLEGEFRVKDLAVPIWHVGQAIHPSYHCDLSHGIAECTVNVMLLGMGGDQSQIGCSLRILTTIKGRAQQSVIIPCYQRLERSDLHLWPL